MEKSGSLFELALGHSPLPGSAPKEGGPHGGGEGPKHGLR